MNRHVTPLMYGKARVNVMKAFNMTPEAARSWLAENTRNDTTKSRIVLLSYRVTALEKLAGPHGATIARMIAAKKEKSND